MDFFLHPFHEIMGTNLPTVTQIAAAPVEESWLSSLFNPSLELFCEVMIKLHEVTGWNYWAIIMALTVSTRLLLMPVTARIFAANIRTRNLAPEMFAFTERMKVASQSGNYAMRNQILIEQQEFMTKNGASPLTALKFIALQAPLFIFAFAGLNYFVAHYPELASTGGTLWFENLAVSDPYYRLPLITASGVLIGFELGAEQGVADRRTFMRVFAFGMMSLMVFFTGSFAQALHIMWASSSWAALVNAQILRRGAAKKFFNIPEIRQVAAPKTEQEMVSENLKLLLKRSKGQKKEQ